MTSMRPIDISEVIATLELEETIKVDPSPISLEEVFQEIRDMGIDNNRIFELIKDDPTLRKQLVSLWSMPDRELGVTEAYIAKRLCENS